MFIEQLKSERDNIKWRDEMIEKYSEMLDECQGMYIGKLQNLVKKLDL